MDLAKSMLNNVWLERSKYEEAERVFHAHLAKSSGASGDQNVTNNKRLSGEGGSVVQLIAEARQKIHDSMNSLRSPRGVSSNGGAVPAFVKSLEEENATLKQQMAELLSKFVAMEARLSQVENKCGVSSSAPAATQVAASNPDDDEDDDDDDDLFGSDDEEDEKAAKLKAERLAAYAAKKSKKPALVAKSNIILDVKPWDDETDMAELEKCVRSVKCDGLVWGTSKLVKIAYGITKLVIVCVVEDDKVGTDFLEEEITAFDEYIQSVDVAAFNKV